MAVKSDIERAEAKREEEEEEEEAEAEVNEPVEAERAVRAC